MARRPSAVVAAVAACALIGCAASWPRVAPAKADPAFLARQRPVTTVDILPIDLEAWTQPGVNKSSDDLRTGAELGILGAAAQELLARGYIVGNAIGWDGQYVTPDGGNGVALAPDAVLATVDSLSSYGLAAEHSSGLPVPFLPARLGEATGTDATLYIGGWTFAGQDRSRASRIVKGVLIGVVIIGVVVVLAVLSRGKGGDGLGGLGSAANAAVRTAASVGRVAARAALRAGNVTVQLARGPAHNAEEILDATAQVLDAWGRSTTHISVGGGGGGSARPVWSERPEVPRHGHSRTYLELTLVDNHTGLVLWHARQQFPAHAGSEPAARRILGVVMASLPAAGIAP